MAKGRYKQGEMRQCRECQCEMGTAFADRTGDICEGCEMWQRGYDQGLKDGGGSAGPDRRERIATAALTGMDTDCGNEATRQVVARAAIALADTVIALLDAKTDEPHLGAAGKGGA
jgi:hypothetical protein